ncbi:hypothetical protein [Streptomyces sp. NPDC057557]|uniref:hypothetical protein n=1 Tax=Streptomyces sp. NPDC057557 TaxID=3346167 RepID=UPI00367F40D4
MANVLTIGRSPADPTLDDWYVDEVPLSGWMFWFDCDGPAPRTDGVLFTRNREDLHALLGRPATVNGARPRKVPRTLPSGRIPLYRCSQCGDLGCGAFAARVTYARQADPAIVTWSDFAWESDAAPEPGSDSEFAGLPPIEFDLGPYENVIRTLLT